MHSLLLSLVAVVGADAYITNNSSAEYAATNAQGVMNAEMMGHGHHGGGQGACGDGNCGAGGRGNGRMRACGPMPQTCYDPRYGCYGSSSRYVQRYPAFHGTYYRRPYNYRNLFDYPWHADLHEPTSLFSYNVPGTNENNPAATGAPTPAPTSSAIRPQQQRGPTLATPPSGMIKR